MHRKTTISPIFLIWISTNRTFRYLAHKETDNNKFNLTVIYFLLSFAVIPILLIDNKEFISDNLFLRLIDLFSANFCIRFTQANFKPI
jgi:hypothetical protein